MFDFRPSGSLKPLFESEETSRSFKIHSGRTSNPGRKSSMSEVNMYIAYVYRQGFHGTSPVLQKKNKKSVKNGFTESMNISSINKITFSRSDKLLQGGHYISNIRFYSFHKNGVFQLFQLFKKVCFSNLTAKTRVQLKRLTFITYKQNHGHGDKLNLQITTEQLYITIYNNSCEAIILSKL